VHQFLVQHEDSSGVVVDHGLHGIEQVRYDLIQVKGVADLLRDFKQELVFLFIGEFHIVLSYNEFWGDSRHIAGSLVGGNCRT